MAQQVKVWFDAEGDFLEVRFSDKPGFMRETNNDAVMERVDEQATSRLLHRASEPMAGQATGRDLVPSLNDLSSPLTSRHWKF